MEFFGILRCAQDDCKGKGKDKSKAKAIAVLSVITTRKAEADFFGREKEKQR